MNLYSVQCEVQCSTIKKTNKLRTSFVIEATNPTEAIYIFMLNYIEVNMLSSLTFSDFYVHKFSGHTVL